MQRLWALYRTLRGGWASACDRVGEAAETALLDAPRWPPAARRAATPALAALGEASAWLRLSPRQPVWRTDSELGRVTVIGDPAEIGRLDAVLAARLGPMSPAHGRIGLWQVPSAVKAALAEGDACVVGLPRHLGPLLLPPADYAFSFEPMVRQVVVLDRVSDLRGRDHQGLRRELRAFDTWAPVARTSTSRAEFEYFHDALYVPHVQRRHGKHAFVSVKERQWHDWMRRGGRLLFIEVGGTIAVGGLVMLVGRRAMLIEEGVNDALAGEPYFGALQGALKRAAIEWARSVGAAELSLGLSPAAAIHGIFRAKRLWGARLEPSRRTLVPTWTFMTRQLSPGLQHALNGRRIVTFAGEHPRVLRLVGPGDSRPAPDRPAAALRQDGFEAVLEVGPGRRRVRPLEEADGRGDRERVAAVP